MFKAIEMIGKFTNLGNKAINKNLKIIKEI